MIWIGKNTKIRLLEKDGTGLIGGDSMIIFGKNNSGKTKIFNELKKKYSQEYCDLDNSSFVFYEGIPIFIDNSGDECNVEYEKPTLNFMNQIQIWNRMRWSTFFSIDHFDLNKLKMSISNLTGIEKINFSDPKFAFKFLSFSLQAFNNHIDQLLKIATQFSDKEKKEVLSYLILGIKFLKLNDRIKKMGDEEKKVFNQALNIGHYFSDDFKEKLIRMDENKKTFEKIIKFIQRIYKFEFYQAIFAKNKYTVRKNIKRKGLSNLIDILTGHEIQGNSFGINKFNKILQLIIEGLRRGSKFFVLDDPFEGLDLNSSDRLSNMLVELTKNKLKIIVLTSNINSFRQMKNLNKNISTCILHFEEDITYIEEITSIDNIFFKFHDKNYYYDLINFIKQPTVSYAIALLLVASHRQQIYETQNILNIIDEVPEDVTSKIDQIYTQMTGILKARKENLKINKDIKQEKHNYIEAYTNNYFETQIMALLNQGMNHFATNDSISKIFIISLSKIAVATVIESLSEEIQSIQNKWKQDFLKQHNRNESIKLLLDCIKEGKGWRNNLMHPKEHPYIWSYMCPTIPQIYVNLINLGFIREILMGEDSKSIIESALQKK